MLTKWDIICRLKDLGGLGVENLEVKNRCLLTKWLHMLSIETEGMWVQILRNKYIQSKTLTQVTVRPNDSLFSKGLMTTKVAFFYRMKFTIRDGNSTRFWEDMWLGGTPLATQYPSLYNFVQHKEAYVAAVLQSNPINIQFRRSLVGDRWEAWLHLVRRLMDVNLSDESDSIHWKLTTNDIFQ